MKNKINNKIKMGLLFYAIFSFTKQFFEVPHFISGFLIGISIACYIMGAIELNHDISKFKNWKKSLIKRI